jgi:hypothetical protein
MMGYTRYCALPLVALAMVSSQPAFASEGGATPFLRGLRSFQSGIVPPEEGLYLADTIYVYDGEAEAVVLQGQVQGEATANAEANLFQATVVYPTKILGANLASSVTIPVSHIELSGRLTTPNGFPSRSQDTTALGDITVAPVILGWHSGNWHYSANVAIALPLGNFDDTKVVNAGRNTYAIEPSAAVTYFDPKSGWDISLASTYVITYENEATDYDSGDLVQFDWAIGKQLNKQFKIGLVGYGMIQVTDDSGDGAVLGRFRSEVFSVGGAASYNFMLGKQPMALSARYYHEFGVKNTFEGSAFFVGLSTKL